MALSLRRLGVPEQALGEIPQGFGIVVAFLNFRVHACTSHSQLSGSGTQSLGVVAVIIWLGTPKFGDCIKIIVYELGIFFNGIYLYV